MLIASEKQIRAFVSHLFRYADEGSFISLRAFDQKDRGKPALLIEGVRVGTDINHIVTQATFAAERAANEAVPAVFAPPVATFNNSRTARSIDVANGVAISVEVDSGDPIAARIRLEGLIGPVTIALKSGGEWVDPESGEVHDKVHLHWRLSEPTSTARDHTRLQYAREMAARLVGGDPTAAPAAHPLRWPGSWNRKAAPKMARIFVGNEAAEVHLEYAIEKLEEAIEAAGFGAPNGQTARVSGSATAQMSLVADAMSHIPNSDLHWDDWVRMGMAAYRASGGSQDGLQAWSDWSAKSKKHEDQACVDRWAHFAGSPPTRIGPGTIFFMAAGNGWQRPEREAPEPPPPVDEGIWQAYEREASMSADQWHDMEQRESGRSIPASAEAKAAAGDKLLWKVTEGWDEAAIPPRPWIAKGYIMRGAVTVVSGPGSAGKSSLMVAWSSCLALGCQFNNFRTPDAMKVGTYNVEDDEFEQKRRFSSMARELHVDVGRIMENLVILGPSGIGTLLHMTPDGRMLVNTPVMDAMESWIGEYRPDVLILDPFVELHAEEENDNTAVRAVMAFFRRLAATYAMGVVILHHSRKGLATPGDPDSLRGASAIVGAARVALTVNVMTEDEADAANIAKADRRDFFRLDGAKSNYAPIEDAEWFERRVNTLANDDAVAIAWPWKMPSVWKDMVPQDRDDALDRIAAGPAPGILYAPSNRGAANARWVGNPMMQIMKVNEKQAVSMVKAWLQSGLLAVSEYRDATSRKMVQGVTVDRSKVS